MFLVLAHCLGQDLRSTRSHGRRRFRQLVRLGVEGSKDDGNVVPASTAHVPLLRQLARCCRRVACSNVEVLE